MISVEEAKALLYEAIKPLAPIEISLTEALGYVLTQDIYSPVSLPLFDQSSMDGYAIATDDSGDNKSFKVIGEIKAGDGAFYELKAGEAIRIFTGAAVPPSADSVVIQEKVACKDGLILLTEDYKKGAYIRRKGTQIKQGELAMEKGTLLNPACIGLIAAIGIDKVSVFRKPLVSIIATGDEIVAPGNMLKAGEIFESNTFTIQAALQQMRTTINDISMVRDDKLLLKDKIQQGLGSSDLLIIAGGISVGKYDFVLEVLNELNVHTLFYKVLQMPGKPFFAGTINGKWVFALPGNPASALVCFYEYVYPAIRLMSGIENAHLTIEKSKLLKDIQKKENRALFIRAKKTELGVLPLEGQDSGMLRSFAEANVLIYVPKDNQCIKEGELVEVHILPMIN